MYKITTNKTGATCPPPFNIIPTPKSLLYFIQWLKRKFFGQSKAIKKEHMKTIRVRENAQKFMNISAINIHSLFSYYFILFMAEHKEIFIKIRLYRCLADAVKTWWTQNFYGEQMMNLKNFSPIGHHMGAMKIVCISGKHLPILKI